MNRSRPIMLLLLILMLAITLMLNGCAGNPPVSSRPEHVVTTSISPLADLIRQVAGNRVTVVNLVPAGSDPHDYDPKPSDMRQVAASVIFFANGVGEELYLDKLVKNAGNNKLQVIVLSDGLPILEKTAASPGNPHLWLDVQNSMAYVEKIRDALGQAFPADKDYFTQNAQAYLRQLHDLETWVQTQVAAIPAENRKMIVFHNAWSYYAQRYGLTVLRPVVGAGESEPSAKDYAELLSLIKDNHVRAVFGEAGFNPKLVQQLAHDAGVQYVGNLHDDTLSDTVGFNSYLNMIKSDTNAIVAALR